METHPDLDLSAYLDGELAAPDRARLEAHVAACVRCRARLADLRETASLVAALPSPRPARSLVPRVAGRLEWLRPLRSLSALASGAFLFMFLVTAIARSGSGLGGAGATVSAPAATAAASAAASAAPAAAPALPQVGFGGAVPQASGSADMKIAATSAPDTAQRTSGESSPQALTARGEREAPRAPAPLSEPLLWLGLAVVAAAIAFGAHRRLRAR